MVQAARTFGGALYRMNDQSQVSVSTDDGLSWKRKDGGPYADSDWLELSAKEGIFAIGYSRGLFVNVGAAKPIQFPLPRKTTDGGPAFSGVARGPDGVYLIVEEPPKLLRVSARAPWSEWKEVRVAVKRIADADSTGNGFAVIGWDSRDRPVVVDIGAERAVVLPLPMELGLLDTISCHGTACAILADRVISTVTVREKEGGAWRDYGTVFELLRWFAANCDATELGPQGEEIRATNDRTRYRAIGLAFDGTDWLVAGYWKTARETYVPFSILVRADGVAVVPGAGLRGVWSPTPGEFWLFGTGFLQVNADRDLVHGERRKEPPQPHPAKLSDPQSECSGASKDDKSVPEDRGSSRLKR